VVEAGPSMRLYAAVVHALALTRGQLYSVKFGELSKEDVDRILQGTSFENIAAALGLRESEIAINCAKDEKASINGYVRPHES
jgi:hypothetical protein